MGLGLSLVMPSCGAPSTLSSGPIHTLALHSICLHSQKHRCGQGSLYLLDHHLPPLPRPEPHGSWALSLVLCQLHSVLNSSRRSLTKGEGQVWLSFSSLPFSHLPHPTSPCLSLWTGWRGGVSLASKKEGTKGEVWLCSLLRGTKLRPLFPLGRRLRGSSQI